jgi:GR25 family glycosyltransferase involved in LPS biosynthesis
MNEKARPSDGGFLRDEQWGCWRSHANMWKRVIDEKLETALILEDDVDWDVNVHDVFEVLSRQMRRGKLRQTSMTMRERTAAPYGE